MDAEAGLPHTAPQSHIALRQGEALLELDVNTHDSSDAYVGLAELPDRTFHCAKGGLISLDDQVRTTSRLMQKVSLCSPQAP